MIKKQKTLKSNKEKNLKWIYISVGGILCLLVSFTLIYDLLIPDVCYYHFNKMNSFMNLFYSAGGGDNGHPSPTFLNVLSSLFIGGIIGNGVFEIFINKN